MTEGGGIPVELEKCVNRLRNTNPEKFQTMCKMHLSFLLDLSGASLQEFMSDEAILDTTAAILPPPCSRHHKKAFNTFTKRKGKTVSSMLLGASLSEDCLKQVLHLVQYLEQPSNITLEGIFRKTGMLNRQKVLKERLYLGQPLGLDSGEFSAHDCANVLKSYLKDLQEPLLIERYFKAHCQIPGMMPTGESKYPLTEADKKRIHNKQIKTVQLLFLLLPLENIQLLERILFLLHRVSSIKETKMTAPTLGTLFSPLIVCPRKMSAYELHAIFETATQTVAFMIENAPELFKIPLDLAHDIATYWRQMESEPQRAKTPDEESDSKQGLRKDSSLALNTCVTFVDRDASRKASQNNDTETALAQLYAYVQSLPESTKKRKLLKQFNNANGGVATPLEVSVCNTTKNHKRGKSFGDSIKKKILKGLKPKSDHSIHDTTSNQNISYHLDYESYRHCDKENIADYVTPVKQLFPETHIKRSPSSQVCVVDMSLNSTFDSGVLSPISPATGLKRKAYDNFAGESMISLTPLVDLGRDTRRVLSTSTVEPPAKRQHILDSKTVRSLLSPLSSKHPHGFTKSMVTPRCRMPLALSSSPKSFDDAVLSIPDNYKQSWI